MPMSRPGSESAEFWVDGSRRDGTVEEFYTLSSELGRFVPSERGQKCHLESGPQPGTRTRSSSGGSSVQSAAEVNVGLTGSEEVMSFITTGADLL